VGERGKFQSFGFLGLQLPQFGAMLAAGGGGLKKGIARA
jgi:hypothetical protein